MLAALFHAYGFSRSACPSLVGRKGPFSFRNPKSPEQPGPPLVQKTRGFSSGASAASTYLCLWVIGLGMGVGG